jgi:GGDEF domain-containing protein
MIGVPTHSFVVLPLVLSLADWLGIVAVILGAGPMVVFCFDLANRIRQTSAKLAFREFSYLISRPWHIALIVITLAFSVVLAVRPPTTRPASLLVLVPVVGGVLLLVSFFLIQSRRLAAEEVIRSMRLLVKRYPERAGNGRSSAVRFDLDRLKAISVYSRQLGDEIRKAAAMIIEEEAKRLRDRGNVVEMIELPGEDETVVITIGCTLDQAGDFADQVRRRLRQEVRAMDGYAGAVRQIVEQMDTPPSTAEEQQGIGTISAGVAAGSSGPEIWFSDVSAAVKESKVRGRNKTVIHRPGLPPEIRSDFGAG